MQQVLLVCGNWSFERNKWIFFVDKSKGGIVLQANSETSYTDFLQMVYEDFDLDQQIYEVKLMYKLSKKYSNNLPQDTPPFLVASSRQLSQFLEQFKNETVCLCVEVRKKVGEESVDEDVLSDKDEGVACRGEKKRMRSTSSEEKNEGEEEEESRFDCYDDPDGASSDDEDFQMSGRCAEGEEEMQSAEQKKKGRSSIPEFVKLEMTSVDLAVGQRYDSKEEFEMRLMMLSVAHQFDYDVGYSTPKLLTVNCWIKGCTWRVRAGTLEDGSPNFYIKVYVGHHSCSVTERSARSRKATHELLGRLYKDFVGGVGPTVMPNHVADALNKRYGLRIKYWKAYRILKSARELVRGSSEDGYEDLPSYLYMIRRANPGTLVKLEVDEEDRFKFLFIAFGASIEGFRYMRKVVVVDGTYLQGKYKGTLLIATTQDGNFNIFPIAFGVVDTENDESWQWFFRQLHRIIPDDAGLAIISDRHKSIGKAIATVYPQASRGICTYHLHKNILLKFKGGEYFGLVKKAATAYRVLEFNQFFQQIEAYNPALHAYLHKADIHMWSRVHFPGDRFNFTTSNIAESINKALSHARGYPIVELLDAIRSLLTRWFATRRQNASVMPTTLTTGVEEVLAERVAQSKLWTVQDIDVEKKQVSCGAILHVVNFRAKQCTCRRFDLDKIPCVHALAAAEVSMVSRVSLCNPYYHREYLYNAYSKVVMPRDIALPVPEDVVKKVCKPPIVRQPPGRPKLTRIKGALEVAMERKRPRKEHVCSNCHEKGHNRQTCKM